MEKRRHSTRVSLMTSYRAMSPILTKIEGLVVNTNTGKACKLESYYHYWEKIIYDSIKQVYVLFMSTQQLYKVR